MSLHSQKLENQLGLQLKDYVALTKRYKEAHEGMREYASTFQQLKSAMYRIHQMSNNYSRLLMSREEQDKLQKEQRRMMNELHEAQKLLGLQSTDNPHSGSTTDNHYSDATMETNAQSINSTKPFTASELKTSPLDNSISSEQDSENSLHISATDNDKNHKHTEREESTIKSVTNTMNNNHSTSSDLVELSSSNDSNDEKPDANVMTKTSRIKQNLSKYSGSQAVNESLESDTKLEHKTNAATKATLQTANDSNFISTKQSAKKHSNHKIKSPRPKIDIDSISILPIPSALNDDQRLRRLSLIQAKTKKPVHLNLEDKFNRITQSSNLHRKGSVMRNHV